MHLGKIVETATRAELFRDPHHPYTQALFSAASVADPSNSRGRERIILSGDLPTASNSLAGYEFRTRCPAVIDRCHHEMPSLLAVTDPEDESACHLVTAENATTDIHTVGGKRVYNPS